MNAPSTAFPPLTSEAVRTAFSLLDRLDSQSPLKPPSLLRVFRLYCVQEMTVAQVAHDLRLAGREHTLGDFVARIECLARQRDAAQRTGREP